VIGTLLKINPSFQPQIADSCLKYGILKGISKNTIAGRDHREIWQNLHGQIKLSQAEDHS